MDGTASETHRDVMFDVDAPPADPVEVLRTWLDRARSGGVREPGALALATSDPDGNVTNRIVQVNSVTDEGLVFTSHAGSRKGRDIEATGRSSGVLYWRETGEQITVTGTAHRMSAERSDALWAERAISAHPMSVVSEQSAPLRDEGSMLAEAQHLADLGTPLPRPENWVGYHLVASAVEFWRSSPNRLHRRLRYDRDGDSWTTCRLQP